MSGRSLFAKYKKVIGLMTACYSVLPRSVRLKKLNRFRRKNGKIGMVKRYALLKTLAKKIGDNVSIHPDVYLFHVEKLEIGDNVSIHPFSYVEAAGGISIGNNVSLAEGSSVFSVNHSFEVCDTPIKYQPVDLRPVVIEDDVWIASKATILGGVTVASGTVVAAGAVVTKNTEKNTVWAGVPAKRILKRLGASSPLSILWLQESMILRLMPGSCQLFCPDLTQLLT